MLATSEILALCVCVCVLCVSVEHQIFDRLHLTEEKKDDYFGGKTKKKDQNKKQAGETKRSRATKRATATRRRELEHDPPKKKTKRGTNAQINESLN